MRLETEIKCPETSCMMFLCKISFLSMFVGREAGAVLFLEVCEAERGFGMQNMQFTGPQSAASIMRHV